MSAAAPASAPTGGAGGSSASLRGERLKEGSKEHDVRAANIIAGKFWPASRRNRGLWLPSHCRVVIPCCSRLACPLARFYAVICFECCSEGCCGCCSHVAGPARHGQNDSVAGRRRHRHKRRRYHSEVSCAPVCVDRILFSGFWRQR